MKNFKIVFTLIAAISIILLAIAGCGQIKYYPTSVLESAAGGTDNSTFPFELNDGKGPLDGLSINAVSGNDAFTAAAISTDEAYEGNSSLKLTCYYNGSSTNSGGILAYTASGMTLTGKTLTAYVWVPANMFGSSSPYGGSFFIQMKNSYNWYQGPGTSGWQNISTPSGAVVGLWNQVSANVDEMVLSSNSAITIAGSGENANNYLMWGFKVGQGTGAVNYSGVIYIDSINIQ